MAAEKLIRFPAELARQPLFLGRNGEFACHGLAISSYGAVPATLQIRPLRANGTTGRCAIELPADPAVIRETIRALEAAALACELPHRRPAALTGREEEG